MRPDDGSASARVRIAGVSAAFAALLALPASAAPPRPAPPLPPPDPAVYEIIHVDNAQALADAAWALESNQAIIIAAGEYDLAGVDFPNGVDGRITIGRHGAAPIHNVQLRGATGDPADVVLRGAGMLDDRVPYGIQLFTASGVTLADFSVGEVYYHAIGIEGTHGAREVLIHNVRAFDAGQQVIKGSGAGADDVRVAFSRVEYTIGAIEHPEGSPPGSCYTNGIDITGGHRWTISDSIIQRIRCRDGTLAGPAILAWQGAADTLVERNLILDSSRGVSLGLVGPGDHSGGIVRNNLLRWEPAAGYEIDVAIYTTSANAAIVHNTALVRGRYPNAIEVRYAGASGVVVAHNLLDAAVQPRDGADPVLSDNLVDAQPDWFVDEAAGDLRLSSQGLAAVPQRPRRIDATDDCLARGRLPMTELGACAAEADAIFADGFES